MSAIKDKLIQIFPRLYDEYVLEQRFGVRRLKKCHRQRIREIRREGKVHVSFIISSISMWRLEPVCLELMKDDRFHVDFIICPFSSFVQEQRDACTKELVDYCEANGWRYQVWETGQTQGCIVEASVLFYPQLYGHLFDNSLDCEKNLDRLIAYVPYGLPTVSGEWMYNSRYMNTVWKLFFPTELHREYARHHSFNHARNMEIVGDSHAREFLLDPHHDVWKKQDTPKKRIIWAPHFSIGENGYLHRAGFLWLSSLMPELAREYQEELQFVFKPHPRLMSELYRHPDWGKKKTDEYYAWWANGLNTQLETGGYVDLFCTSDGMIHDCGSFTAEYLYTGKPVLFTAQDFKSIYEGLDLFGTKCMDLHYHTGDESGIRMFLEETVLKGTDPMATERNAFKNQYLASDSNMGFEKKIYRSLAEALFAR